MRKYLIAAALWLTTVPALAQSVQQSGQVTPGHATRWTTNGVIQDAGTAASGSLTSLGVTANGTGICQNSGPITGAYASICLGVTSAGVGTISVQSFGGAPSPTIVFAIDGIPGLPNGALAPTPAATFKGNPTSATATPVDFTVQGLVAKTVPDANNDFLVMWDSVAGTLKKVTPGQIAAGSVAGVASIGGMTGAISCGPNLNCAASTITPGATVAALDPTVNDDTGDGYVRGSTWVNTAPNNTTGRIFAAYSVGAAAAQWYGIGVYDFGNNAMLGQGAGGSFTTATFNTLIGHRPGQSITSGSENFFGGNNVGGACTVCTQNVAIGPGALSAAVADNGHVAIGFNALLNMSGIPLGTPPNQLGPWNTAIGNAAMQSMTTGGSNACVGRGCMVSATDDAFNACIGHGCLLRGFNNISVAALGNIAGGAELVGSPRPLTVPDPGVLVFPFSNEQFSIAVGEYSGSAVAAIAFPTVGYKNRIAIGSYSRVGSANNSAWIGNTFQSVGTSGKIWSKFDRSVLGGGATTLTAAQVVTGYIRRQVSGGQPAAPFTDTLPAPADIVLAGPGNGVDVPVSTRWRVINDTTFTWTLGNNGFSTTSGGNTIAALTAIEFAVTITNSTAGAERVSFFRVDP